MALSCLIGTPLCQKTEVFPGNVPKQEMILLCLGMKMMTEIFEEHLKKDGYLKKAFAGVQGIFLNLSV